MKKNNYRGGHHAWWSARQILLSNKRALFAAGRRKQRAVSGRQVGQRKTSLILLPERLIVERDDQRAELRRALDSAWAALRGANTRVKFDFSRVGKIFPGGMLVFVAQLHLLNALYPGRIAVRAPHGSIAAQLIDHFNINEILGVPPSGRTPRDESVVNWRFLTGTGAEGEKITRLLSSYKEQNEAEIPEGLYDVLAEAFTNVRHHAFPADSTLPEQLRRWWLFSRYVAPNDGDQGYLYIAIYDIGVGIQRSLRKKLLAGEWALDAADEILTLVNANQPKRLEKLLLKRAVEHERSSTGLKHRGLGLPEMKDFVLSTEAGRLYILSGQAQYSCVAATGKGDVFECLNGFPGTLILWSLPLSKKKDLV